MLPGEDEFGGSDFAEDDGPVGAILGTILLQVTIGGQSDLEPKYTAYSSFEPGTMATLYIENDTDFRLSNLQLTRDQSPVNDAQLFGSLAQANPIGNITGASNATPIVITLPSHGLTTGQVVIVDEVEGNYAANGVWSVTVIDANTFSLDTSVGNAAYVGGGRVWLGVPGATNLALTYQAGSNGNYIGLIPGTVPLSATIASYTKFIFCNNYVLHWGASPITVGIRT